MPTSGQQHIPPQPSTMSTAVHDFSMKRMLRRRASNACTNCRKRKVRCDVTRTSQACSNCRYNSSECVVLSRGPILTLSSRRSHGSSPESEKSTHIDLHIPPGDRVRLATPPRHESLPGVLDVEDSTLSFFSVDDTASNSSFNLSDLSTQSSKHRKETESHHEVAEEIGLFQQGIGLERGTASLKSVTKYWQDTDRSQSMFERNRQLDSEGCFRLPGQPLFRRLMESYFLYVNPMLPLLNEGDFWESLSTLDQIICHKNIVLLQAMLFAACAFFDEDDVKALGFQNIRHAKRCFYKRAKLLYHAQPQGNRALMAQSAILLTYWCPSLGHGDKNTSNIWLNRAIRHVKALEAGVCDHDAEGSLSFTGQHNHKSLLRRIWRCCVIRDRLLSLCLRREIQIPREYLDRHATMIMNAEEFLGTTGEALVYENNTNRSLITIMLLLTELCLSISGILTTAYPVNLPVPSPNDLVGRVAQIDDSRRDLSNWVAKAVATSEIMASTQHDYHDRGNLEDPVYLFANLAWIYYHSAQITVCNYELLLSAASEPSTSCDTTPLHLATATTVRAELWDAATHVSRRLGGLIRMGLARWLPSSIVGCTAMPLALYLLSMKLSPVGPPHRASQGSSARLKKQVELNTLISSMRLFQNMYEGVDWVTKAIRYFMDCTYFEPAVACHSIPYQDRDTTEISWDVISTSPAIYVKLVLTLDLSLSQDRLPIEKDFPPQLQTWLNGTGCFMPILFSQGEEYSFMDENLVAVEDLSYRSWHCMKSGSAQKDENLDGWIENDQSLFFAREMGLIPDLNYAA